MKNLKFIGIFLLFGICFSCSDNDELTQEQEEQNLIQMFSEIESSARSVNCNDSSEWDFTSYGSKNCGGFGPVGFIAYSINIDTQLFLEKIEKHKRAQQRFNEKWEIISDCSLASTPISIICEDGSPVFAY
ncbi:hypothetical protein ESY86_05510 [Subsaximicrobium wynnwilliamsii]|uniref:Uncharacterized protein n=1 Tax=Subsaximicrobium wynnwilliamsii TaxID=291179 RepID=A0A5C6ZIX7_9FLAO|nr:hypothetical protein [Subsaximicrobium wynnwilliamsii]TXD84516.1 hypothetical protein ESY87_05285 [Subsaximicrobium wynnwilliamsii]TXD90198.1 hypothetical protein ESY86_05510 [Subsaximicrobium wynnwilliamsii]TXE04249.1 hypothetical protein ESY88_05280 [Subsaximicrobium wynnwilliamsii]